MRVVEQEGHKARRHRESAGGGRTRAFGCFARGVRNRIRRESGGKGIASPRVTSFSALPGVTTEKCVMNCNLPSCLIWKSSLCRFSTAWPVESCTTTRTGTRFARDSSGTGEVRVLISGVEAAVVETGSAEAGAVADGAVNCAADD